MTIKAYYRLNGNSNDAAGNANNGVDTAISYSQANGVLNQGISLNGTSSKIVIPDSNSLDCLSMTVNHWYRHPVGASTTFRGISKNNSANTHLLWTTQVLANGKIEFNLEHDGGTISHSLQSTKNITADGKFHMLTYVYNGSNSTCYLYIDGIFSNSGLLNDGNTNFSGNIQVTTGQLNIGMIKWANVSYYGKGEVDEVIIDNTVWTVTRIKNEYSRIKGFF